jgi:hypothetical protein
MEQFNRGYWRLPLRVVDYPPPIQVHALFLVDTRLREPPHGSPAAQVVDGHIARARALVFDRLGVSGWRETDLWQRRVSIFEGRMVTARAFHTGTFEVFVRASSSPLDPLAFERLAGFLGGKLDPLDVPGMIVSGIEVNVDHDARRVA